MATFAQRLRQLREAKGLSQYDMARIAKMPRSTYGNYEAGTREPDMERAIWFADFFGVTLDYIMGRSDDPTGVVSETQGARVRRLRLAAGLTVEELAERAECSPELLQQVEAGEARLTGFTLIRVGEELGVSGEYLDCRTNDPTIRTSLPPDWEQAVRKFIERGYSLETLQGLYELLEREREQMQDRRDA